MIRLKVNNQGLAIHYTNLDLLLLREDFKRRNEMDPIPLQLIVHDSFDTLLAIHYYCTSSFSITKRSNYITTTIKSVYVYTKHTYIYMIQGSVR